MPLPSKPVFISVEIHVIDGNPGAAMRKRRHKGSMSSVMLKPHSRYKLATRSLEGTHLDLRKETDVGFPNIQT